jgi:hypothetical protein
MQRAHAVATIIKMQRLFCRFSQHCFFVNTLTFAVAMNAFAYIIHKSFTQLATPSGKLSIALHNAVHVS